MTLRNEAMRLPFFLNWYRGLGVGHFLVIDNGSDDGSLELLRDEPDVSLWQTDRSYRAARFGLDWMGWLQFRHAHDHWCLMVDADELLVYDKSDRHDLRELTSHLASVGQDAFGALMLDLYPDGALGSQACDPGDDPRDVLTHFDDGPYRAQRQRPMGNLWVQGGARERVFFADRPEKSPTLNKVPLIRWNRRYVYVNSTHSALPPTLNRAYDGPGDTRPSGVLLHTKFLPDIVARSALEKKRGEHFHTPSDFQSYYDDIGEMPSMMHDQAVRYDGPDQLIQAGLMSRIDWR